LRLILGESAQESLGGCDAALSWLYDREADLEVHGKEIGAARLPLNGSPISRAPADPLAESMLAARSLLAEACQHGLRHLTPDWARRMGVTGEHCAELGLKTISGLLATLAAQPEPQRWLDCALLIFRQSLL
jgi:hypothetical protein